MLLITEKFKYINNSILSMTSLEEHKNNFEQFMEDINEKIRAGLLVERQKIVGFAASEASTNLVEYLLHKKNLIPSGFKVNHTYFASEKRAEQYLDFDFPNKKEILSLMIKQDEFRTILCYGKEKKEEIIMDAVANINTLKKLIEDILGEVL